MPSLARVGGCAGWAELARHSNERRCGRISCTSAAHCRESRQRRALHSLAQTSHKESLRRALLHRRALRSLLQTRQRGLRSRREALARLAQ